LLEPGLSDSALTAGTACLQFQEDN
jgi:hypothetical protein